MRFTVVLLWEKWYLQKIPAVIFHCRNFHFSIVDLPPPQLIAITFQSQLYMRHKMLWLSFGVLYCLR
jgi:hypothetical protein